MSLSPALVALEDAWAAIRRHHPDVPAAVVTIGQGSDPRAPAMLRRGNWAAGRWSRPEDGTDHHEVMIAAERLADGAEGVLSALLTVAAHGLAHVRKIAATSRAGRYHNRRFKDLVEELLLDVSQDRTHGWAITELSPAARERYSAELAALDRAARGYRRPESGPKTTPKRRSRVLLVCGCGRKLYGARGVVEVGPILCGVCGEPFEAQDAD